MRSISTTCPRGGIVGKIPELRPTVPKAEIASKINLSVEKSVITCKNMTAEITQIKAREINVRACR
jgi:hypothetical protein